MQRIAAGRSHTAASQCSEELLDNGLDAGMSLAIGLAMTGMIPQLSQATSDRGAFAGATQITITVKEGGKKLLDLPGQWTWRPGVWPLSPSCGMHAWRGCMLTLGLWAADRRPASAVQAACHSKLRYFEDLDSLSTLGFRGEALCVHLFGGTPLSCHKDGRRAHRLQGHLQVQ